VPAVPGLYGRARAGGARCEWSRRFYDYDYDYDCAHIYDSQLSGYGDGSFERDPALPLGALLPSVAYFSYLRPRCVYREQGGMPGVRRERERDVCVFGESGGASFSFARGRGERGRSRGERLGRARVCGVM
jgi:hypothetical protein